MKHSEYLVQRKRMKAHLQEVDDLDELAELRNSIEVKSQTVAKSLAAMFDQRMFELRQKEGKTLATKIKLTNIGRITRRALHR